MVEQEWVSAETEVIHTEASEVVGCTWKGTLSNSESGIELDVVIFARGCEILYDKEVRYPKNRY